MAFKQKIPVLAGAAVLLGGLLALLLLARPPEEDRLRAAVQEHARSLGPVRDVQIHGAVADILLGPDGRSVFAEFAERGGKWVFVKDVGREFAEMMRAPEKEREALNRLAQRLGNQLRIPVSLREGLQVEMQVGRDDLGLVGQYLVRFAFPKSGDQDPQRGRYVETYRYRDGAWALEGTVGRLLLEKVKGNSP